MEKIIIIDHIEDILKDEDIVGKECFDKTGDSVKVKKGRGGSLEKKWDELVIGRAYSFQIGEFKPEGKDKSYPYVVDFKSVEGQLVKQAQERVETKTGDTRDRSMSVSYSKDLVVAGKLDLGQLLTQADKIYQYIIGNDDDASVATKPKFQKPSKEEAAVIRKKITAALEKIDNTANPDIDMEWLKASLEGWTDVVGWMRKQYMITGGAGVKGVLALMTPLQREHFIKEVKNKLKKE